eukprot:TRINITY_DN79995_c0_g1_i1.p1 TRINITY_DN79995_c0_g1~~TRINITY_DN79995_c0_g1_i1.p1  ORF type:complete len:1312 (+),score=365.97 TRINITY_DN79995_c0_g1_i1:77-4012(+)
MRFCCWLAVVSVCPLVSLCLRLGDNELYYAGDELEDFKGDPDKKNQPNTESSNEVAEAAQYAREKSGEAGASDAQKEKAAKKTSKKVREKGGLSDFGKGKSKNPFSIGPKSDESRVKALQRWKSVVVGLSKNCGSERFLQSYLHPVNCRLAVGILKSLKALKKRYEEGNSKKSSDSSSSSSDSSGSSDSSSENSGESSGNSGRSSSLVGYSEEDEDARVDNSHVPALLDEAIADHEADFQGALAWAESETRSTTEWFSSDKSLKYVADALQSVVVRFLYSQWWNSPTTLFKSIGDTPEHRIAANPVTMGSCSYTRYCVMGTGGTGEPVQNSLAEAYVSEWTKSTKSRGASITAPDYFLSAEVTIYKSWEAATLQWINAMASSLKTAYKGTTPIVHISDSMPGKWRQFIKSFVSAWSISDVTPSKDSEETPHLIILDQYDIMESDGSFKDKFGELCTKLLEAGGPRHLALRADQMVLPPIENIISSTGNLLTIHALSDMGPMLRMDASDLGITRLSGGAVVTMRTITASWEKGSAGSYFSTKSDIEEGSVQCCIQASDMYTLLTSAAPRELHEFAHAPREYDLMWLYVALGLPLPLNTGDQPDHNFDQYTSHSNMIYADKPDQTFTVGQESPTQGKWDMGSGMPVSKSTWTLMTQRYTDLESACGNVTLDSFKEPWPAIHEVICKEYESIVKYLKDNTPSDDSTVSDGKTLQQFHTFRLQWRSMQRWLQLFIDVEDDFNVDDFATQHVYAQDSEAPEESSRTVLAAASGMGGVSMMYAYFLTHNKDFGWKAKGDMAIIGTYQQGVEGGLHVETLNEFKMNEEKDPQPDQKVMVTMEMMYMESQPLMNHLFPTGSRLIQYSNDEEEDLRDMIKSQLEGNSASTISVLNVEPIMYKPSGGKFVSAFHPREGTCERQKDQTLGSCVFVTDTHEGQGITDVKAFLKVLTSTKTNRTEPFFFLIDTTLVAAGGFPLSDLLGGNKIPSWLHIVEAQSWFKLHERGEEISPAGVVVIHSGDRKAHDKLVKGLLSLRTAGGWGLPDRSAAALRFGGLLSRENVKGYWSQAVTGSHKLARALTEATNSNNGAITCSGGAPPCPRNISILHNHSSDEPQQMTQPPFLYVQVNNKHEQTCFETSVMARLISLTEKSGVPIVRHRSFAFDHVLNIEKSEGFYLMRMTASLPEAVIDKLVSVMKEEKDKENFLCPYVSSGSGGSAGTDLGGPDSNSASSSPMDSTPGDEARGGGGGAMDSAFGGGAAGDSNAPPGGAGGVGGDSLRDDSTSDNDEADGSDEDSSDDKDNEEESSDKEDSDKNTEK